MPSLGRFAKTRYLPELPEGHPGIRIKNAALDSVLDNNASLDARAVRARCCSGRNLAVAGWLTGWQAAFKRFQCIIHMYITVEMVALGAVLLDFRRCVSGSASFFFLFPLCTILLRFFFFFSRCCGVERERNAREITMTDERAATCKAELPTLAPCIVACMTFSLLTPILCENTWIHAYCTEEMRWCMLRWQLCHCISTIGHQAHLAAYRRRKNRLITPFLRVACSRSRLAMQPRHIRYKSPLDIG